MFTRETWKAQMRTFLLRANVRLTQDVQLSGHIIYCENATWLDMPRGSLGMPPCAS